MLKTETVINRILTQGEASKIGVRLPPAIPIDNELPSKAEIRSWLEGHDQINLFTNRQLPSCTARLSWRLRSVMTDYN